MCINILLLQYVSYERPTLSKGYLKADGKFKSSKLDLIRTWQQPVTKIGLQVLQDFQGSMHVLVEVEKSKHLTGTRRKVCFGAVC